MHVHGGGFVAMSSSSHQTYTREWANSLEVPVFSVDYRLSPQSKFPCALNDVWQVYYWLMEKGEKYFRDLETDLISRLTKNENDNLIISTGGGLPLLEENRKILKSLGFVVWLRASVDNIMERTGGSNHRPLLQTEDPRAVVTKMLEDRNTIYTDCAHLTINTDDLAITDTAHGIIESAQCFFSDY